MEVKAGRDLRIDVVRGLALIMIFINHIPGNIFSAVTLKAFGFADAAEMFVLLAGVSAALAFGRQFDSGEPLRGTAAVASRIWKLYVAHLVMFVIVAGISAFAAARFDDPLYLEALGLDTFVAEPAVAIVRVVTLTFLPSYMDILPLYILLLALLPLLFTLSRLHSGAVLGVSGALYFAMQIAPVNLPNYQAAREWFFNPFAWQFLFVIGFALGRLMARDGLRALFARKRLALWVTVCAAAYVFFAFLVAAPWRGLPGLANVVLLPPEWLPLINKTNLSPFRLLDALARLWLILALVAPQAAFLSLLPGRVLGRMGRHSLDVFCFGVVASVIAGIIVHQTGFDLTIMVAVNFIGIALMVAVAEVIEWHRRPRSARTGPVRGETGGSLQEPVQVAPDPPLARPAES